MSETRSGYARSASGLVGALVACFLVIVFVWGLTRFQHRGHADPAETVGYSAQLADARAQAPFDVLAPRPTPPGWRATSVTWQGAGPEVSWHLGFLTSRQEYVGLEQGNAIPREFIADRTPADVPGDPVDINGQRWQTLSSGHETALVLEGDEVTTIVTGTASTAELIGFAESLSAH
ncbi:MAG: DUF4245 domain-containing protein [Nocardioidaceae bacterium]